jgi:transcriptional regulator with XRE-family HTH domain
MPRLPLSDDEREWGRRLAEVLRDRRRVVGVSAEALAVTAGVSVETVRRIERGLVPSPGFFTIAVLARALALDLDDLAGAAQSTNASGAAL